MVCHLMPLEMTLVLFGEGVKTVQKTHSSGTFERLIWDQ